MKQLAHVTQRWLRISGPSLRAHLCRLFYGSDNVSIGHNFRCDGMPRCLVDPDSELVIGNSVEFRSGVEVRVHASARVVIEDGARIDRGVRILATNASLVRIGAGARIGLYSVLNGGDDINVGCKALVSGFVYLQTSMHRFTNQNVAIRDQGYEHGPISVGDNAWLAAQVVVMPEVTIGAGAVVGSNAVVTRNVEPGVIVAGVPAQPLNLQDPTAKE